MREGQLCYLCLLVFRATTLIKRQAQKGWLSSSLNKESIVTHSPLSCGMWKGQQSPSSCPVGGENSSPTNEILFQVRDLHLGQTSPLNPRFSY